MTLDERIKELLAEALRSLLKEQLEPLVRRHQQTAELDPLRAYSDKELRTLLGGMSATTLYELRTRGLIASSFAYPGSRMRRTTARQVQQYLDWLNEHEARPDEAVAREDADLEAKLAGVSQRRRRRSTIK